MDNFYNNYNNGDNNFENNMGSTANSGMENTGNTGTENASSVVSENKETENANSVVLENRGMENTDSVVSESKETENANSAVSSTGAAGSIYSYSYVNQENQERNPNYYERREENNSRAQRTYTTGGYEGAQTGNTADNSRVQNTYTTGGYESAQAGNAADNNSAWNQSQGYSAGNVNQTSWTAEGNFRNQGNYSNQGTPYKKEKKKAARVKKQHGFGMTVAKCAALALVFGLVSGTVFYGTGLAFKYTTGLDDTRQESIAESAEKAEVTATTNSGSLSATSVSTATTVTDVSDIAENVMPSIVSITNMSLAVERDFFGRYYQEEVPGAGSGIIVGQNDEEIYIATNNHVVANSTQLTVNFVDDQQVTAEIKGTDASTDLAVVSVKTKDIPSDTLNKIKVATLGSSDNIKVGQSVVAIGNALGYGQSVTTGVISALEREVTIQDETTGTYVTNDLLQTDAAINPGNSGGALLNMNGELIGINSAKYSDTQVEGMGYAIPISAAEPIINNLITREIVDESNSAYLGVSGQDVTSEVAKSFGMPEGLYITMVAENSAAEQAGIRKGDVITKFDGRKITSMDGLSDTIKYYSAGSQVEVTVQRNDNGEWREETITVTLGKKND